MTLWISLRHIETGRIVAHLTPPSFFSGRWEFIQCEVGDIAACHPDDVDLVETEDGDTITVHGEPTYLILDGYVHNEPVRSSVEEAA